MRIEIWENDPEIIMDVFARIFFMKLYEIKIMLTNY